MKTCYIVGAGEFYGEFTPADDDLVIAADGGYDSLLKRGIRTDVLIGDLDSIKEIPVGIELIRHPVKKDETDMHLAYLEGRRRGYENFELFGGVGGRADHTFANYCLLSYARANGAHARLHDKDSVAYAIRNEATRVRGKCGNHISLFAFGGAAKGVFIKGLYYELENGTLTSDFPLGVSNQFTNEYAEIEVRDGTLLVIEEIQKKY